LKDLGAGLLVGVVSIPLNVAFAIGSGVQPVIGLSTAVIAGFIIALLSGSSSQIGGLTGAFMSMIYVILSRHGMDGLILATLMAGVMLIVLGSAKLGSIIRFIPFPVLIGFTSGIAVIILTSQINDFLGLGIEKVPAEFLEKWEAYFVHLNSFNPYAFLIALGTVVGIVVINKIDRRIPAALILLLKTTVVATIFQLPVQTIGSKYGPISKGFMLPSFPVFSFQRLSDLLLPAFSIAMLGGIESLLSAVVADGMTGKKHDSNMELLAQGLANVGSALFGGIPVTGAIARTATNIKAGGQTQVSGLIYSLVLLGTLLFLSPLAAMIPLATLAGILATVAYNMSEQHVFRTLLKGPRGDILALVATFLLTILIDLTIAIPAGILLALIAFIRKMSQVTDFKIHRKVFQDVPPEIDPLGMTELSIPDGVEVMEITGPLFFGAAEELRKAFRIEKEFAPRIRILRLRNVPAIDASGLMILRDMVQEAQGLNVQLFFAAVQPNVMEAMKKIGLTKMLGESNIFPNVVVALNRAQAILGQQMVPLTERLRIGGEPMVIQARDIYDAVQQVGDSLTFPVEIKKRITQALLVRETLMPTTLGYGFCFPHPREMNVLPPEEKELVRWVYLEPPLSSPVDQEPVNYMVVLLSLTAQRHLKVLSKLASLARKAEFREALRSKPNLEELISLVEAYQPTL